MTPLFLSSLSLVACLCASAARADPERPAAESDDVASQVRALAEKVKALEARVETLEKRPSAGAGSPPPTQSEAYNIAVADSPILGSKNGKVEVVVFGDYQCPFTARVFPLLSEIAKDDELKGRVKVVFKHFPLSFHKDARPAAKAALAARDLGGDEKFWAMSALLFANQRELTEENMQRWATEIGLDGKRFADTLRKNDEKYEGIIKRDMDLGANSAKVRGTPSLFVNGWELRTRSVDGVKQLATDKKLR